MAEKTKKAKAAEQDLQKWEGIFKELKTEEEAKKYIKKEVYKLGITKGCMSAYMKAYHADEDKTWFKEAAYVEEPKTVMTVVADKDGNPVKKLNKKGKVITKKERVETGETVVRYNHAKAKNAWLEKYGIEVKETKFKANTSKEDFDPFADLF